MRIWIEFKRKSITELHWYIYLSWIIHERSFFSFCIILLLHKSLCILQTSALYSLSSLTLSQSHVSTLQPIFSTLQIEVPSSCRGPTTMHHRIQIIHITHEEERRRICIHRSRRRSIQRKRSYLCCRCVWIRIWWVVVMLSIPFFSIECRGVISS